MLTIDFDENLGEPDILLFGDQADYLNYLNKVKEENLPYVPFTVIMAEGRLTYGGEMSDTEPTDIEMCPVFASFTENRNVMFIRNIMGKCVEDSGYYSDNCNCEDLSKIEVGSKFVAIPGEYEESDKVEGISYVTISSTDYKLEGESVCYALQATTDADNEELIKMITNREFKQEFIKADLNVIDDEKLMERIKQVKLYEKIIDNLNNISIPNNQRINDIQDEFYCNENVYGNFNLIFVYGFISFK